MTDTKKMAAGLASLGRHGDDHLVHMSGAEIRGIQALAPHRRVHVNPKTGLPEMFDFGDILQLGGTVAASFFGGPLAGAAVNAALTAARTGDLGKGIASGALSYGMGSALAGAGDAANEVAGKAVADAATDATAKGATGAALEGTNSVASPTLSDGMTASSSAANPSAAGAGGAGSAPASSVGQSMPASSAAKFGDDVGMAGAQSAPGAGAANGAANYGAAQQVGTLNNPAASPSIMDRLSSGVDTAKNMANNPGAVADKVWSNIKANPLTTAGATMVGAAGMMQPSAQTQNQAAPSNNQPAFNYTKAAPLNRQYNPAPSNYNPGVDPEWQYYTPNVMKSGGAVALAKGGIAGLQDNPVMQSGGYAPENNGPANVPGALLPGDSGGMDDQITAKADGSQDVLLSDGEFIIPADVVAHLGDGNSKAGARRLEQMMDQIRQQKTGKQEQPGKLRLNKVMV